MFVLLSMWVKVGWLGLVARVLAVSPTFESLAVAVRMMALEFLKLSAVLLPVILLSRTCQIEQAFRIHPRDATGLALDILKDLSLDTVYNREP